MPAKRHPVEVVHVKDGRPSSGTTVLVDRVWPRGQRKDNAPWDEWLKAVAPSTELRKWYGHDPEKHKEFIRRYRKELQADEQADAFRHLQELHQRKRVNLMTATKELKLSQAQALADFLAGS